MPLWVSVLLRFGPDHLPQKAEHHQSLTGHEMIPEQVEVERFDEEGEVLEVLTFPVREVRNGFVFVEDGGFGGPYCLKDGYYCCSMEPGLRLTQDSLKACQTAAPMGPHLG